MKTAPSKLYSDQGVWKVAYDGDECLRATSPSQTPTTVNLLQVVSLSQLGGLRLTFQYYDWYKKTWLDDPVLTVIGLSERPSIECEVRISLSEDITRDMEEQGVAGVYRADGTYYWGRPVFRHSGGEFTLSVWGVGCWEVTSGDGGSMYLWSTLSPSMCPADPRVAKHERRGRTHWIYKSKQGEHIESGDISVTCNKHKY